MSYYLFFSKYPFFKINRKGATSLIISSVVSTAAFSLIALFSSIYIYELSLKIGLDKQSAIFIIILFFLTLYISKLIFLLVGEKFSSRHGFKHTIWLSFIPFSIYLPFIILSSNYFLFLFFAALFWGAHEGLFWWGYHGYLIKSKNKNNYGETIGSAIFLHTLASVITPILGAISISIYGFNSIFIIAFLLITISLLILGLDGEKQQKHDMGLKDVFKNIPKQPILFLSYISRSISMDTYAIFWNLYLFLLFGSLIELGFIVSASVVISAFLMIFIGKYIDKHGERKTILVSSPIMVSAWALRVLFKDIGSIVTSNTLGGLGGRIMTVSLDDISYKQANHSKTALALLFREFGLLIGTLIVLILGACFVYFYDKFEPLFLVATVTSLFPLMLILKKNG